MSPAPDRTISISEWIDEEALRHRAFRIWWNAQAKRHPDVYPPTMPAGEWDEQYRLWEPEE